MYRYIYLFLLSIKLELVSLQVSRLNLAKYAKDSCISKPLFEYIFYHEGDIRSAMEMAVQATQSSEFKDWWWKVQLAKCYMALNLVREAEQQLRSAIKQQYHVDTFIRLIRVYMKLGKKQLITSISGT